MNVVDCHVVYWEADIPQFLTIKRSPQERYPLIWQCVTGGINTNERAYKEVLINRAEVHKIRMTRICWIEKNRNIG